VREYTQRTGRSAAWLARLLWEQEAGGSNPPVPTRKGPLSGLFCLQRCAGLANALVPERLEEVLQEDGSLALLVL
jgi:hypothetical protein